MSRAAPSTPATTPGSTRPRTRAAVAGLVVALLLALAACSSSGGASGSPPDTAVPTATLVARPAGDTEVFGSPDASRPDQVLPSHTEFGSALALVIVDDSVPGWFEVQLPTRPNESTGWIRAEGVEVRRTTMAVHVDLEARRLVVTDGGEVVLETAVAVGSPDTPTPTGRFYLVDKLDTGGEPGPYGPFAFGLSAHSEVLTEFAGGDGQVGIHGTNDPSSIGRPVSNGCVRVPNDVAVELNGLLPLGTPVIVV